MYYTFFSVHLYHTTDDKEPFVKKESYETHDSFPEHFFIILHKVYI